MLMHTYTDCTILPAAQYTRESRLQRSLSICSAARTRGPRLDVKQDDWTGLLEAAAESRGLQLQGAAGPAAQSKEERRSRQPEGPERKKTKKLPIRVDPSINPRDGGPSGAGPAAPRSAHPSPAPRSPSCSCRAMLPLPLR